MMIFNDLEELANIEGASSVLGQFYCASINFLESQTFE